MNPRSVKDLGSSLLLDSATLSPLLKRLEATGYLTRERKATDERVLDVSLTPEGRALRQQAERIPPRIAKELGMSVDQLAGLRSTLQTVVGAATRA